MGKRVELLAASLLLTAGILAPAGARAQLQPSSQNQQRIFAWRIWQSGFDFGLRSIGHFGTGAALYAPPGGWMLQGGYHLWYSHLIEAHASAGVGLSNATFMFGAGAKLNMLEFIDDPSGEVYARGLQRGLLAGLLKNFMVFASVDLQHFSFPSPTVAGSYDTSSWAFLPGAGAQWYFYVPTSFAIRWYLETSLTYATFSGAKYLAPFFGVGVELR